MPLQSCPVEGLQGLLSKVLEIGEPVRPDGFLWFRGLGCSKLSLLPKLLRDRKSAEDVFDRERRLLTRFRQRSMAYWPTGYPQNDWEHLFAMQHYGMPTRLLDWSENLFVAAHFALTSPIDHPPTDEHEGPCKPIIWCMDPVAWNRSTPVLSEFGNAIQVLTTADDDLDAYRPDTSKRRPKSPLAMFGAHNSARIVAQRGTFVIWGNDAQPMERFAEEQAATLWGLELNGDSAVLAGSLRLIGFGETMVFPELPSLGTELTRSVGWRT
jgi:hypothetical protein